MAKLDLTVTLALSFYFFGCTSSEPSTGAMGAGGQGGASTGGSTGTGTGGGSGGTGTGGARPRGPGGTAGGGVPGSGPFPSTATIYQDVSKAKVDSESTTIMQALEAAGWNGNNTAFSLGIDVSMTILTADANVARRAFQNNGDDPD